MKKRLLAAVSAGLCLGGLGTEAMAQSSVTIYGIIDTGVEYLNHTNAAGQGKLRTLPLLRQDAFEAMSSLSAHCHLGQPCLWVRRGEQAGKLASRLNHRYGTHPLAL